MPTTLLMLLKSLVGRDIQKMSDDDATDFKGRVFSQFRPASSNLPALLLPWARDLDLFTWSVEPGDDGLNWIARFSVRTVEGIEANLGESELVRMAAAAWPGAMLMVDLFGEYHSLSGMDDVPILEAVVRVYGDPALHALECTDPRLCDELMKLARSNGFDLCVRAVECATEDLMNPTDLSDAFAQVATAARSASDEPALVEAVELKVIIPVTNRLSERSLRSALELSGVIFGSCAFARTGQQEN